MSARVINDDGGDITTHEYSKSLDDATKLERLELNLQKAKEMSEIGQNEEVGGSGNTDNEAGKVLKKRKTKKNTDSSKDEVVYAPEIDEVTTDKDHLASLRGEGRYFGVMDPDVAQPVCSNCHRRGHKRAKCKVVVCHACGKVDDHYETQCPNSMVCSNCGERGHFRNNCPSKRKQTYCVECDSRFHSSDRCPSIWRSYVLKKGQTSKIAYPTSKVFCYNCASKGHYGDDCPESRVSKTPNVNGSAFSGANLPKQLIDQYNDLLNRENGSSRKRKFDNYNTNYNYAPPAYPRFNNYNDGNYNNNNNNNNNNKNSGNNNNSNRNDTNKRYNNNNDGYNRNYSSSNNNRNMPKGPSKVGFIPLRNGSQNQRRNQNYSGNNSSHNYSTKSSYLNNNSNNRNGYRNNYGKRY